MSKIPNTEWTLLEHYDNQVALYRCSCGVEKLLYSKNIRSGSSKSCGHLKSLEHKFPVGTVIGEWTVLGHNAGGDKKYWEVQCSCGKVSHERRRSLKNGFPRSCGHLLVPSVRPEFYREAFGEKKTLRGWARDERCTVAYGTLLERVRRGIPLEEAITTPPWSLRK